VFANSNKQLVATASLWMSEFAALTANLRHAVDTSETTERLLPPDAQKIAPAFSGYRPSMAVCRRALFPEYGRTSTRQRVTHAIELSSTATVIGDSSWRRTGLRCNSYHRDNSAAFIPPYDAGEH
jgi:hypothetical protein